MSTPVRIFSWIGFYCAWQTSILPNISDFTENKLLSVVYHKTSPKLGVNTSQTTKAFYGIMDYANIGGCLDRKKRRRSAMDNFTNCSGSRCHTCPMDTFHTCYQQYQQLHHAIEYPSSTINRCDQCYYCLPLVHRHWRCLRDRTALFCQPRLSLSDFPLATCLADSGFSQLQRRESSNLALLFRFRYYRSW